MDEEHEHEDAVPEQAEPEMDLSEEEGFPSDVHQEKPIEEAPPFVHTPESVYSYEGETETQHPVLGLLVRGQKYSWSAEPKVISAIESYVADGVLRPMTSGSEPTREDETA